MNKIRVFVPAHTRKTCVEKWVYRNKVLRVKFTNGLWTKSDYTLTELLKLPVTALDYPIEVEGGKDD